MYIVIHTGGGRGRRNTHITIIGTIVLHTLWGGGGDGETYIRVAEGGERNIKGGDGETHFSKSRQSNILRQGL